MEAITWAEVFKQIIVGIKYIAIGTGVVIVGMVALALISFIAWFLMDKITDLFMR